MIEAVHDSATGRNGLLISTTAGDVLMWLAGAEDGDLVVVVRGAFAPAADYESLDAPGSQFAFLHLPGFHSPAWEQVSVPLICSAYAQALAEAFPGRAFTAVGVSTGALVALSLPAKAIVAVEPFLRTGHLWALFRNFAQLNLAPQARAWVAQMFGAPGEGYDYSDLLTALTTPTIALVGQDSLLPMRDIRALPSLCDEQDRRVLHGHPLVTVVETPGGHAVPHQAVQAALTRALTLGAS